MQIFTELNENKNLSLALGYFDGVHLGHKAVIDSAVGFAKEHNIKSAVITFKNHPCYHFYKIKPEYILQSREEYIEKLGIDYLYEIDFDDRISKLSAKEYLEKILIMHFSPKAISTGFNHYFGSNKSGDTRFLSNMQNEFGYKYFEIPAQKIENEIISSTSIRKYLTNGQIQHANTMLGHNFTVEGKVIKGQQIGRKLGFKTANIKYPQTLIEIPHGVYKVRTKYGMGIANFGVRPTITDKSEPVLETHILDFDKDIYGEKLVVEFLKMIRKEQKFNSSDELRAQIKKDITLLTNPQNNMC